MYLTKCAVCATELGLTLGKKCGRCSTRYCGPECQKQHWEEGGHDKLCKLIKKAGGAEQYNANTKYTAAVAVAAEACAEDTKGQTCYICTQALHWKTKEGVVRMCACRGTAGFAHVSCLAEQAKILVAEVEENNLGHKALNERWARWYRCSLCKQEYHGVVRCALGWACWKTYLGRPEVDQVRGMAMSLLGNGLSEANHHEDAISVYETELAMKRRLGASEHAMLNVQSSLACSYEMRGRDEEALPLRRDIYTKWLELHGMEHEETLSEASNLGHALLYANRFEEARALFRKMMPVARRVLGDSNGTTLRMALNYACGLYEDPAATLDDLREAVATLAETDRIAGRVLGSAHPVAMAIEYNLRGARAELNAREVDVSSVCEAVAEMTPIAWREPPPLKLGEDVAKPEVVATEPATQTQRQKGLMEARYLHQSDIPDNPEADGMETFHVDASTVEIPAASLADLERDLREAVARYSNGDAAAKKEVEHLLRALHARRDPEKIKRGAGPCRMSNESK